jgi:cyanophycinase
MQFGSIKLDFVLLGFVLALGSACASVRSETSASRELVIVGGGGTTPEMVARALELARGPQTKVVVLPQASESEQRGEDSAQMWRDAGAAEVVNLSDLSDRGRAVAELERADLVWFSGGDQSKLTAALAAADLTELVRRRAREGVTFGGTSAGAAVMSPLMITGEGRDPLTSLAPGATELVEGLGLWPGTIVDQHFVARQRNNRLLGAVLDHPDHVGFGIDERTALVVVGDQIEVLGEGAVVVVDARRASGEPPGPEKVSASRGLELHVLRSGMRHRLEP